MDDLDVSEDLVLGVLPAVGDRVRFLSVDEKRAYALEYAQISYGYKRAYLNRVGIDGRTLRGWQSALVDGDLDAGLIPVEGVRMSKSVANEIARLSRAMEAMKSEYEQKLAAKEERLAAKDERIEALERACESLGKAISVMSRVTEEKDMEEPR